MGPASFHLQPDSNGLGASWWFFDEFKDTNFDVLDSFVGSRGEVFCYTLVCCFNFYVPEVVNKPVFQSEHGLSHILHATPRAGDGIH